MTEPQKLSRAEIANLFDVPVGMELAGYAKFIFDGRKEWDKFVAEDLLEMLRPWIEKLEAELNDQNR